MQGSFCFFDNVDNYDLNNFIVHDGNKVAFEFVTSGTILNNNIYLLTGANGSGKTYICNIWDNLNRDDKKINSIDFLNIENVIQVNDKKYILEDLEKSKINEEKLLHLINFVMEINGTLLITSSNFLDDFSFILPDLQSRFKNIYNIKIGNFNDDIKKQILLKLLNDKQLNLNINTINYIVKNIDNSYKQIIDFVDMVNKYNDKINLSAIKSIIEYQHCQIKLKQNNNINLFLK